MKVFDVSQTKATSIYIFGEVNLFVHPKLGNSNRKVNV